MNLKIFQEVKPVTGANVLVGAIYLATVPGTLVNSVVYTGPYTGQTELANFNGLTDAVYIYICWESPDGSATGTQRNNFQVQPNNTGFQVREDLYLTADVSPFFASGTNFYGQDSSLIGWNWSLERKAQGTQKSVENFNKTVAGVTTGNSNTSADGWALAQPGDIIAPAEEFIMHFYPQVVSTSTPTGAKIISTTNLVKVNTSLSASAAGQSFLLQGSGGYFDLILPSIATVPDNTPIFIMSAGGSHINVGINCFSGDQFQWAGFGTNTKIILAQDEQMMIYRFTFPDTSKKWLIGFISESVKLIGEIIWSTSKTVQNTLFADGTATISKTNYARLALFVSGLVATGGAVSGADWGDSFVENGITYFTNHGSYQWDNVSSVFGLPILYETGFVRAVISNPGKLQMYSVGKHVHAQMAGVAPGTGATPPVKLLGFTNVGGVIADANNTDQNDDLGTGDNRPNNIGQYALIRF